MLLVARRANRLQEVADEIEGLGGVAYVHTCDLSDTDDIDRMCTEVLEQHEAVDVLVNNAGKSIRRSVDRAYDLFVDHQWQNAARRVLRGGQADPEPAADDAQAGVRATS